MKSSKEYAKRKSESILPHDLQWIDQLREVASRLKDNEDIPKDQLNIDLFKSRIFVHSPKGDIFNLPEGALPLDFAYMVHTDIAKHASGFKVNGKIHPFDKPLQNGDIIEVVTSKLAQPKQAWKQLVTTTHARDKLQQQLKKSSVAGIILSAAKVIHNNKAPNKKKKN